MQERTLNSASPLAQISGSIERVTYHNAENGYCVLRVKVRNQADLVTVIGHLTTATPGESIEAQGVWIQHRDFGAQFKAQSLRSVHPSSLEGIEKYLGSGMVKGIGPHFAKKLVQAFKEKVFDVIEHTPERLKEVRGMGPVRIQKITSAWQDQKVIRDIMVFLQSHGVSPSRAVRIYKTYGQDAVAKVTENPYQLAKDIHGIGFKSADLIASHLGISKTSLIRARAGLHFVLQEKTGEGHCAYPEDELLKEGSRLLEIEQESLREALNLELQEKALIKETIQEEVCIYSSSLYRCESEIAQALKRIQAHPIVWPLPKDSDESEQALASIESQLKINLDPLQKEAITQALSSKVMIIAGGPGTGKTTLTRSLLTLLGQKRIRILLASPTGRAAKRLSECTGLEAKTIHRLLGFDPKKGGFLYHAENPLPADLLLLDEASMIDVPLMHHLLKAVPPSCALILVGDVDQLPSVGPGTVLKSLIDSGRIRTVRLTQIFRQSAESQIIQTAHQIRQGRLPDLSRKERDSDFHFLGLEENEAILEKIIQLVTKRIPQAFGFNPTKEIQVLCPMNRGILGTRSLNLALQKALNPNLNSESAEKIERFGITFAVGDKVMVTSNDYDKEVFNGDMGTIQSLDRIEQEALIDFDGRAVLFDFNEMDILTLAYAVSIHKSQGSEYPAVILPLSTQHFTLLKRNLIYTGLTRGKKLVLMIGQKKALAIAVKSSDQGVRWTSLSEKIQAAL